MCHRIPKTNKLFTISEELILPARTCIFREVLGGWAARKLTQVPGLARTVAKRVEDMSEDIET